MSAIIIGYLATMDGMVEYIIQSAQNVSQTQILILVMEGVVLSFLAVIYTWYLSYQVRVGTLWLG